MSTVIQWDWDLYYATLCGEAQYEKDSPNPRTTIFGCPFKFVANAIRHVMIEESQARWIESYKALYQQKFGTVWGLGANAQELASMERILIELYWSIRTPSETLLLTRSAC